jgi:hypothetical protein
MKVTSHLNSTRTALPKATWLFTTVRLVKMPAQKMGAAWAAKVPIIGLYAKGEDLGLMRKMANHWCSSVAQLFDTVSFYAETVQCPKPKSIQTLYNDLMDRAKGKLPIKNNLFCKCGGNVSVSVRTDRAFFECVKCGEEVEI